MKVLVLFVVFFKLMCMKCCLIVVFFGVYEYHFLYISFILIFLFINLLFKSFVVFCIVKCLFLL